MPIPDRRSALGAVLLAVSWVGLLYAAIGAPGLTALTPPGRDPGALQLGMLGLSAVIAALSLAPARSWWAARQQRAPLSAAWAGRLAGLAAGVFVVGMLTCVVAGLILPRLLAGPAEATLSLAGLRVVIWSGLAAALVAPLGWRTLYRWFGRDGVAPGQSSTFRARPVQVALLFVLAASFALIFGRALMAETANGPGAIHLGTAALVLFAAGIAAVTFLPTLRWLLRRR
ncbi:hypothetical protein K4043_18000 [Stenotrophomonas sp. SRS1]|uniref:hypothetical protein n=1 Tax=Stenotrophomonas sp. SRS1 TaxID=2870345 RepID=UPI0022379A97|nr:hypothetical protein [Stenotrophomonas sp. SRS1]MCW6029904.1 hypothetical protein [Stenotrophomonas sp. SRS1]